MSDDPVPSDPVHTPDRAAVRRTVARTILLVLACFVAYFVAPIADGSDAVVVRSAVGLVALCVVIVSQAVAVGRSTSPRLRAVEAISLSVVLVLVTFAAIHVTISANDAGAFSEELDHVDGLYLSMMTMTTIGFGDIGTVSRGARIAVMMQMFVNVVVLGIAVRYVLRHARTHRRTGAASGQTD